MKRFGWLLYPLLALLSSACGGSTEDDSRLDPQPQEPAYGSCYLGEEEIPVHSYTVAEGSQFLLKISPLPQSEILSATTYAVIGLHTDLLGQEVDVTHRFHNDDYLFVYEDPLYYYSNLRPLQGGTLLLERNGEHYLRVEVDVRLFDGTPFRYAHTFSAETGVLIGL